MGDSFMMLALPLVLVFNVAAFLLMYASGQRQAQTYQRHNAELQRLLTEALKTCAMWQENYEKMAEVNATNVATIRTLRGVVKKGGGA